MKSRVYKVHYIDKATLWVRDPKTGKDLVFVVERYSADGALYLTKIDTVGCSSTSKMDYKHIHVRKGRGKEDGRHGRALFESDKELYETLESGEYYIG